MSLDTDTNCTNEDNGTNKASFFARHKIMTGLFIAILLLAIISDFSFAMEEKPKENQSNLQVQESIKECARKEILIVLGGVTIQVPREHLNVRLKSGELLYPSAIRNNCNIEKIEHVSSIIIPFSGGYKSVLQIELSDVDIDEKYVTSYTIGNIDKYPQRASNILSDKLTGEERFYLLPLDKSPTANNQPVIIFCGDNNPNNKTSFCDTSYFLPQGPLISYRFFRTNIPVNEYLNIDKKIRQKIEAMIAYAGNNNS